MADPHNVEFEAAKFLQKLIHESTDEPAKLATKLYVILQHMKDSGKENSMPYQVISRAMETVINQHGLDIEALMSSRLPLSSRSHAGESARPQPAGCSQAVGVATDSKSSMIDDDTTRADGFGSGRPPAGPSSIGNDPFQGSVSQRSARSLDHESPSSMDTRSTNSYSQDRREQPSWEQQGIQKDAKRPNIKRKRSDTSGIETQDDITQQLDPHSGVPDIRKEKLISKSEAGGTLLVDPESWKQGFFKGASSIHERAAPGHLSPSVQPDIAMRNLNAASSLDATGVSNVTSNADRISQGGNPSNVCEVGAPGSLASRDTGKFPAAPACATGMPFKEHHLKQLRAQCLVFLAFRNGLSPKRLHLDIALGNILLKEGSSGSVDGAQNELIKDKGKQHTTIEPSSISEVPLPLGNLANVKSDGTSTVSTAVSDVKADLVSKEAENVKLVGKPCLLTDPSRNDGEMKPPLGNGLQEDDTKSLETASSSALMTASLQPDTSGMRSPATPIHDEQSGGASHSSSVVGMNKQLKPDMMRWSRVNHNDLSRVPFHTSIHHDLGSSNESSLMLSQRESNIQSQQRVDSQYSTSWKSIQGADIGHHRARPVNDANMLLRNTLHDGNVSSEIQTRPIPDGSKVVPMSDSSYLRKDSTALSPMDKLSEPEEEEQSLSDSLPPSPKYTLTEKWIMAHQKKKIATQQKWVQKLQKADQRISTCFVELKETVSSSADISAKTRSVIELKKLQLLELQRCLRSNILSDFFKPIQTEMDRLKSIKKHRIGRRLKHVEKYEQKMKEERQKRIRERQKEFFSEVEVHKERLEDVFKFKKERCKGFNRYVKEFHKRKERIHREKIDRIQREKINLLKINDVEGYLRMVQDAKSDRVKQLLKETEKYLLKLGSKLKEAKAAARQVEMDENRIATIDESNDIFTETEDENDQAKHYKESNEKYYLIAHSIKESIAEQPTGLRGGKLREYQMNGLRWLVSLYNNHLNGILADEMGLGKTVQVISLICYLMENKNDRGPFLVVVPSSVLPGWEQELSFWAPGINKIVYAGPPEERRRLFKESIIHQKFNVLLTTYEYLMNKHDRPKLSKLNWHYIIIDEGHRIKNASCKLNADLKLYHSSHRLLLTGTPLQNNLEELWALLNFLLPNIFNSSEDFSQWFNKPFESNGDSSPDEALLSEEENLLIINRLHQVLRPFVLRRLKHKVENELPEKIERLVRCEASAYQKLLMKRVEENLGALGVSKARAVHNSVMELRNICNHPYLSQLHAEEVDNLMPKHFLPPIVRLCGKLEMLDRLLPKLKATNHRVLFFSTMTRLLDVMEEYLAWKQYRYLRLDGHTSGLERGALIEKFNRPDSPFFIFLLSIRAGGVGVNLQAADTVIIFDTDWNPQVDLQAQARAHRIGQKKDVLVLRLETVHTVEEQVRAAAEHKLGVANQSITAGFFDNNTSAEDRREYLESLLRESKKEEAAPVLDDDSLNDILARSESEIDAFEAVDQKRREEEMATWKKLLVEKGGECSEGPPPLPSRLVTEDDLKAFYEAMKLYEVADDGAASGSGMKRKSGSLGGFDTQQYGRGKRAREVRSYEEQWTEEEFEKICQAESPETPKPEEKTDFSLALDSGQTAGKVELSLQTSQAPPSLESSPPIKKEVTPPVKRGRGRPRRMPVGVSSSRINSSPIGAIKPETLVQKVIVPSTVSSSGLDSTITKDDNGDNHQADVISDSSKAVPSLLPADPGVQSNTGSTSVTTQPKRQGRKGQPTEKNIEGTSGTESIKRRGRKPSRVLNPGVPGSLVHDGKPSEQPPIQLSADVSVSKNVLAEGLVGAESKSLEAGTGNAVEDITNSELIMKQTSYETSSVNVPPVTATEKAEFKSLSSSQNASVQESAAAISADATGQDLKPNESSAALILSEASVKVKSDPVSKDKVQVVAISESPAVGSLSSSKTGPKPDEVSPQAANPSSELALPNRVGPRPGRRQNKKPQSGLEPVQRRGRKRGRIVSTDSAPPDPEDKNLNDPVKSAGVTYVAASSEPAKMVMSSHVAAVPVIPLVPVSGFTLGSTPLTGISGSVHHVSMGSASGSNTPVTSQPSALLSGTPAIPPETPKMPVALQIEGQDQKPLAGEKAPRRRGRKKSAVLPADNASSQSLTPKLSNRSSGDFVDRKVIRTRSRQLNISQANNAQEEAHVGNNPTALTGKVLEALQSPNLSSHAVVSSSVLDPASIKADAGSKSQQSTCANPMEEIALCRSPAEIPPISCKGKTNVIVLALELTGPAVSCSKADSKEECSDLQKDFARNVKAKVEVSGLEISCAAGVPAPVVDEELSAPPGFDTPRAAMSDSAARKSSEGYDGGMSKICDPKSGSVVLALESTKLTVDSSSMVCQKFSEKEESSELCNAEFKDSGKQSIPSAKAIGCEPCLESVDTVTIGQPEEEMSAPPGFDIPQRCLSEKAVVVSSKCDDKLASDTLADSALEFKLEDHPQGPGDGKLDAANAPEASPVQGSGTFSLALKVDEQSQGPDDCHAIEDANDPNFDSAATSTLSSKKGEEFHRPNDVNADIIIREALPVSQDLVSHTESATSIDSQEKCPVSDDGNANDAATAATLRTVDSGTASTLTLGSKEELHGPDGGIAAPNAGNAPTASHGVGSNTIAISSSKLKKNEECHEPDNVNVDHDAGNAPAMVHVFGSNTPPSSTLESVGKEVSHGLVDGYEEKEAGDTLTATHVLGFDSVVPSPLESKEKEGIHADDGHAELGVSDAPTTSCNSAFDIAIVPTLGSKGIAECQGNEDSIAEQHAVDASPAFSVGCDGLPASTLESKEDKESHGPDSGDTQHDAVDKYTVQQVVGSDIAACSSLGSKEKEECHEIDDGNACSSGHDTGDVFKGSDITTALISVSKEKEVCYGPDVCNTEQDVRDALIASKDVCTNTAGASTLEEKEQEHGADTKNAELDAGDAFTVSCAISTENAEVGSGDASSVTCVVTHTTESLEEGEKEECCGLDVADSEQDASDAATATSVIDHNITEVSILEEKEQQHDGRDVVDADAPATSCAAGIDTTALFVEEKEQDKSHEPDVGDVLIALPAVGTYTAAATPLEGHHEPDAGNARQDCDGAPLASCVVNTDTAPVSTLEQNDQEEHHDSSVAGTNITTTASLKETDLEEHHAQCWGAKQDVDDALDQQEHHEPDMGDAKQDADEALVDSYAGTNTATAANLEEDYQKKHHELDVGSAEQHVINAPQASCDVGTNTTSASTLNENDMEEHHEPDIGNAEQDVDTAPTESCVVGSDTVATATEEEFDQVEHHELDVSNSEHADNAPSASCDVGTDTARASILEKNDQEEPHDIGNAEQAAADAPAVSCIISTVAATATTAEEKHQEEHHDATAASDDAPTASTGVGTDFTAASADAPTASCGVGTNTTAASADAPTASCGVGTNTTAASCDTPSTSCVVCTDTTTQFGDAPLASCVVAPDTATTLTLEENDHEERTGPDLCHTEQNVDNFHAASCVVNTDATAASDDAPTVSCGVGTDTNSASVDAPTASCGVGTDTTAASCDMPTVSFVVCTDNTTESSDAPSASCVVAPDTATESTLKENNNEENTGPDLRHAEQIVDRTASCVVNTDVTASDDAPIASGGVDTIAASDDAPIASGGVDTISASDDAPIASGGVDTIAASDDAPTASGGVDTIAASDDAPIASGGVDTIAASDDAPTASGGVDTSAASDDAPTASGGVDSIAASDDAPTASFGIGTNTDAPTTSCGVGTDTIAASDDALTASCGVGIETTAASCDTLCTDNTMESGDAPSASCGIAPDTATVLTLEENSNEESTECENGNTEHGAHDASAISSSNDLTTSTFNAEQ